MLIILVGPKGSGKSHIGRLLESALGVRFFHVEPHWMTYHAACSRENRERSIPEGIRLIHPIIAEALQKHPYVSVETTGASPEILNDLLSFKPLLLVNVLAPLQVCLERIASRDPAHQIPVAADTIKQIYELSTAADLPYDIRLENTHLSDQEILDTFRRFIAA
jgi:shikimate kinase